MFNTRVLVHLGELGLEFGFEAKTHSTAQDPWGLEHTETLRKECTSVSPHLHNGLWKILTPEKGQTKQKLT